ncbi:MAG: hypothetical protein JWQ40_3259, partial [Segetibacter sp.]|nr:hypothetical protein [Segetibacter sp.]
MVPILPQNLYKNKKDRDERPFFYNRICDFIL